MRSDLSRGEGKIHRCFPTVSSVNRSFPAAELIVELSDRVPVVQSLASERERNAKRQLARTADLQDGSGGGREDVDVTAAIRHVNRAVLHTVQGSQRAVVV